MMAAVTTVYVTNAKWNGWIKNGRISGHNRNNFSDNFYCDCEFLGKGYPTQEAWGIDYQLDPDYKDKTGRR
jgi:hypothetical protein